MVHMPIAEGDEGVEVISNGLLATLETAALEVELNGGGARRDAERVDELVVLIQVGIGVGGARLAQPCVDGGEVRREDGSIARQVAARNEGLVHVLQNVELLEEELQQALLRLRAGRDPPIEVVPLVVDEGRRTRRR